MTFKHYFVEENFKDKICVRPLNNIHTALNQKCEEKFKGNFYKNKDEKETCAICYMDIETNKFISLK